MNSLRIYPTYSDSFQPVADFVWSKDGNTLTINPIMDEREAARLRAQLKSKEQADG